MKELMNKPVAGPRAPRRPTYLRVVATTRCNYQCSYCHMEGDPQGALTAHELPQHELLGCLDVLARVGMRKIKFLGGEPLLRKDLPEVVSQLRVWAPDADLSVITAGALPVSRQDALFGAGLDRMNVSIHGFGVEAFAKRNANPLHHARRDAFVEGLVERGRPTKLNYVYSGPADDEDLLRLLAWAAPRGLLVNILDNLELELGAKALFEWLIIHRGYPTGKRLERDPHSLDTLHLAWPDGLRVELKHQRLGALAPWTSCSSCPLRARCKEGIFAMRLTHDGMLAPCMDRPDLGMALAPTLKVMGVEYTTALVERYLDRLMFGFDAQLRA